MTHDQTRERLLSKIFYPLFQERRYSLRFLSQNSKNAPGCPRMHFFEGGAMGK